MTKNKKIIFGSVVLCAVAGIGVYEYLSFHPSKFSPDPLNNSPAPVVVPPQPPAPPSVKANILLTPFGLFGSNTTISIDGTPAMDLLVICPRPKRVGKVRLAAVESEFVDEANTASFILETNITKKKAYPFPVVGNPSAEITTYYDKVAELICYQQAPPATLELVSQYFTRAFLKPDVDIQFTINDNLPKPKPKRVFRAKAAKITKADCG